MDDSLMMAEDEASSEYSDAKCLGYQGPYQKTMQALINLIHMESPMCKIEQIYKTFTEALIQEIQAYYRRHQLPQNSIFIDSDTL